MELLQVCLNPQPLPQPLGRRAPTWATVPNGNEGGLMTLAVINNPSGLNFGSLSAKVVCDFIFCRPFFSSLSVWVFNLMLGVKVIAQQPLCISKV